jgi:hypothetical protein
MTSAAAVALGDFDGDAVDDVALGDQCGGWSGPYSQGQFALSTPSTGVFGAFTPLVRAGSQGYSENLGVAVADLSGDGQNDIVIGSGSNDSWAPNSGLGVWQGNGSGTFSVVTPQAGTSSALYRYVVPFDADFDLALDVAATFDGGRIDIWKGRTGTAGLQWKQVITLASGTPEFGRIAAGDFNGDGKDDLCTALSFLADAYPNNGFDTPNYRGLGGTQGVVIYLNTSQ